MKSSRLRPAPDSLRRSPGGVVLGRLAAGGHSLLELLITLGVICLLALLAAPFFGVYLTGAREARMVRNIEALALLEEDHRLATGVYVAGVHDPLDPDHPMGLQRLLGWRPGTGEDVIYVVALEADGYSVTATDRVGGSSITRKYP